MAVRRYLVKVGDKYVAAPNATELTSNRNLAGVFFAGNIDIVFGYWDKLTNGQADIEDFEPETDNN